MVLVLVSSDSETSNQSNESKSNVSDLKERPWNPSNDAWQIVTSNFKHFRESYDPKCKVWRKVAQCNIGDCKSVIRDRSTMSFKRHLKDCHAIESTVTPTHSQSTEREIPSVINYFTPKVISISQVFHTCKDFLCLGYKTLSQRRPKTTSN